MAASRALPIHLLSLVLALVAFSTPGAAQVYEGRELVQAELLTKTSAVVPGQPFLVGVRLQMVPHWHTYWRFPGDAGIPTEIKWALPAGWKTGEIQWPIPLKLSEPGDIDIYGYHDEVLLMQEITPPAQLTESTVKLSAQVDWLVCEKICIPGGTTVQLDLPIAASASSANEDLFDRFQRALPQPAPAAGAASFEWTRRPTELVLQINSAVLANHAAVDFYPLPGEAVVVGHPTAERRPDGVTFRIPIETSESKLGSVPGLVVFGQTAEGAERNAWELGKNTQGTSSTLKAAGAAFAPSVATAAGGLTKALLLGLLGGFILNLMPCVLPVISLKIFGFVQHAGESRAHILRSGLAFVAGIFAWFLGLAVLLILLQRAGNQIGWAVQFTNPYFVLALSAVVFVFALNLFGVFEFNLPQSANRSVIHVTGGSGHLASFFQGLFATVLGTSCTAPVLGAAVGFALSQSAVVILLMFTAIAAGMSAPYLLLSAQPAWVKWLPRPGVWMERLKQLMGFPMLATLVFLLYVLGEQRGPIAVIWTLCFLLVLGLACWMKGAFLIPTASTRSRVVVLVLLAVLVLGGGHYFIREKFAETKLEIGARTMTEGWQAFTPAKLEAELAKGSAVFIDFTAAWCVTCKFNEKTVLESAAVREAFERRGVVKFKADWTNADPAITKILQQFGRPGVPLYVLYPGGKTAAPIVLPELLTRNIVLEQLETIAPRVAAQ
ncbi:MAG TPA: protein-disulfide reductase DsbD domain-containing protein [Chthoniobacterales bacterium]|nr:protein-disulfide reductase DsbD domain-containing protein [Chthoniobacterales bacterium]